MSQFASTFISNASYVLDRLQTTRAKFEYFIKQKGDWLAVLALKGDGR